MKLESLLARLVFFWLQCFATAVVAFDSQRRSDALARTSTAAKYFGAFGAGEPSGDRSFFATRVATSCGLNPKISAVCSTVRRAGKRMLFIMLGPFIRTKNCCQRLVKARVNS